MDVPIQIDKDLYFEAKFDTEALLEGYKDLLIYPLSVLLEGDDEDDDETDSE